MCEKAWGKLPNNRFTTGSYSSLKRPTSFCRASKALRLCRASSLRPTAASALTSQNEQIRNAPTCSL